MYQLNTCTRFDISKMKFPIVITFAAAAGSANAISTPERTVCGTPPAGKVFNYGFDEATACYNSCGTDGGGAAQSLRDGRKAISTTRSAS